MFELVLRNSSGLFRHTVAIAATIILMTVSVAIDTKREITLDNEKMQAIVDSLADSIDRQLQAWRLALNAMSVSTALSEPYDIAAFHEEAIKFSLISNTNVAFYRADEAGLTLLSHSKVPDENMPKYFPKEQIPVFFKSMRDVQKTGISAMSDLFLGPIAGEYIASMIVSKTGKPNSNELLSLNISSRDLSTLLGKLKLPKDYITGVVDRNGIIGARSENPAEFIGKQIPDWYRNLVATQEFGYADGVAVKGAAFDRYRFVFRHLTEAKGWTVSLLVPPTAYPFVSVGTSTIVAGGLSFFVFNLIAWMLGSAQRERADLEKQYQRLTHRLLDELPGAVLRGRITRYGAFEMSLAFGRLSDKIIKNRQFRFEKILSDNINNLMVSADEQVSTEFDLKDGTSIYRLFVTSSPSTDVDNREFNLYILDITNQRSAEMAAINSTRLAALGQMAATLAHEMSQPINVISLAADNADFLLKNNDVTGVEGKIKKIRDFSVKSRGLIDNLLSFARGDNQDRPISAVNLSASVHLAYDLVQAYLSREQIKLKFEIDTTIEVAAHPVELENIFVNLMMNAYDAFRVRPHIVDRLIEISASTTPDHVRVVVRDNAGGIAQDLLQKIFEPFVTSKSIGHGTGLGLSFVSGHIRAWGGEIRVENILGGAQFELVFLRPRHTMDEKRVPELAVL